jgi:hypothetical protein
MPETSRKYDPQCREGPVAKAAIQAARTRAVLAAKSELVGLYGSSDS